MSTNRILFICKKRSTYGVSYGLLNSCRFLCNALEQMGNDAEIALVNDNNDIDREVTKYRPTHVFIEALWVVPSKFEVLIPLHPKVEWYVRLHSNTPFISSEGVAIEWIAKYNALSKKYPQFRIACNADKMKNDIELSLGIKSVYAPNIYMPSSGAIATSPCDETKSHVSIGGFGAIRPLKNQLIQAMAAIAFANKIGKKLTYHINATRSESYGEPNGSATLKNIEELFKDAGQILKPHEWLDWPDFIDLVSSMDLGLQVSMSETFDIVAADFVHVNVPIVGSKEIEWLSDSYQADCTDIKDIISHLEYAWEGRRKNRQRANYDGLVKWNIHAWKQWESLLCHSDFAAPSGKVTVRSF